MIAKIIPYVTGAALISAIISAFIIQQSDASFSVVFKVLLLSISAFIALLCYWKTNFRPTVGILAALAFLSLGLIVFKQEELASYWNVVLTLHLILIGTVLFIDSKNSKNKLLAKITQIFIGLSFGSFIILLFTHVESEWLFQLTFALLTIMALLLIANKMGSIFRK